ncbi:alpha/beta fold hydrolase [Paenactinomyces guangxiensis]|uniref:Alpha/beta hydrolase n=1 Tax=Paenactinomyces guangxiensis TaxID=1490290 RepID=A0A7W1WMT6_9BACL|nr:alpha/beta hydrolase [Paenactinomyces guangxiensis]MBA4492771.1 alpha/beta hydrolase [Paenactinomyces guangxiensis]MBH8590380.1 alpha/beta hydrolase [Paenactinomyces guangxiensis]
MKCQVRDLLIHYEVYGEGTPIIFLHGFGVSHRSLMGSMEPVFASQKGYKRIYVDLPGMGQTPGKAWIKSSDHMLETVSEWIDHILPNQHFILVGESYGGYLARGLVHQRMKEIDGLLLICPAIHPYERILPPQTVLETDPDLLSELTPDEAADFQQISVIQTKRIWNRFKDEISAEKHLPDMDFLTKLRTEGYSFSFDPDSLPEPFAKPAMVVTGRQDHITGYQDAWGILDQYPHASFYVLDRAGHFLTWEQENLFHALVREWLERVRLATGACV